MEEVVYVNTSNYPKPAGTPYPNIYSPGWMNRPNFSWFNQHNQRHLISRITDNRLASSKRTSINLIFTSLILSKI